MGRPFEIISSPRSAEETESSSEEDQSGDEGEGWVPAGEAAEDWEDPSGGVLSQVFDAAEAGDAAGLAELLRGLQVSIDTRVSAAAFQRRERMPVLLQAVELPLHWIANTCFDLASLLALVAGRRQRHRHPPGGAVWPRRLCSGAAGARGTC